MEKYPEACLPQLLQRYPSNHIHGFFERIYALTGSPPPRPDGVMLLTASPTMTIGRRLLRMTLISAMLLTIFHREYIKNKRISETEPPVPLLPDLHFPKHQLLYLYL